MRRHEHGFSLLELAMAIGVMLAVTASVFAVVHPSQGAFAAEPEVADMQQRLRVAGDVLSRDLLLAGAGAYLGSQAGPLAQYLAPVLPFRQGATSGDPPGTFAADRITLLSVPPTAADTALAIDFTAGSTTLQLAAEAGCPAGANLCGFTNDLPLLVYDAQGRYNVFTVTSVADGLSQIVVAGPPDAAETTFGAGAKVVEIASHTYYLKTDPATQIPQLMHYDGTHNADVPVLDHIVGLAFEYYGDPSPPAIIKPIAEPSGPWTTYGPKPPPLDAKPTDYPAGENCVFALDASGQPAPRLAVLGAGPALVLLAPAQLTDGPWCPDALSANRWDADLLRVRRIGVRVRVEAALSALRGPAGVLFTNGDVARRGAGARSGGRRSGAANLSAGAALTSTMKREARTAWQCSSP